MPDVIGSAYVTVRAITTGLSKDISDGIKKGTDDAKVDRAGREAGASYGKGFGDSAETETKRSVTRSVTKAADDPGVKKASESLGRSVTKEISKGLFKDKGVQSDLKRTFSDIGGSLKGAISFPSGKIDWLLVLGAPMLGGVVQILSASLGTIVSLLGQIVLSAGGAGVALGGVFAALGVGLIPILLAFKSAGDEMDAFKASATALLTPFKQIGEATLHTLAPGLLGALKSLQQFVPLMRMFGAEQGRIVGGIARQSAAVLTSKRNMDLWAVGLNQVHDVFKNLGAGVVSLAGVLPSIFTAAMPVARQFSEAIGTLATRFASFIQKIGTAGLAQQFQGWYDKAAQVFRILGDVGLGLLRILKIGSETTGQSMFDRFEVFAKRFEDWTRSVRGHRELEQFFRRSKIVMDEVVLIFADLGRALFGPVAGAAAKTSVVGTLQTIRTTWIPPLKEIIQQFRESSDFSLKAITDEIGRFLDVLSKNPGLVANVISALTTNLSLFTASLKLLNIVLGSGVGRALANFFAPLLPMIAIAHKLNLGKLGMDLFNLSKRISQISETRGGGLAGLFRGFEESAGRAGQNFSKFGAVVQGTAGLVSGYMIGMADDTASMTLSIAASLSNIGLALARGDWITAGISVITTGIGFVVGHFMKAHNEAKKRAAELKKQYEEIGASLTTSFKGAFEEVGTTALSQRPVVALKAIQTELDKSAKGSTTFADSFGVSMVDVANHLGKGTAAFKTWEGEVVSDRIADIMNGDKEATRQWADEISAAATRTVHAVSGMHQVAVTAVNQQATSGQNLKSVIVDLGGQLESGALSFNQYISQLKAAGAPQQVLTRATQEYTKSLAENMLASPAGQWFNQLPGKLRDAGRAYTEQRAVEQAYHAAELANAPVQEQVNARFEETKSKLDATSDAYIRLRTASGQMAATWAQTSTSLLGIVQQIAGDAAKGIAPLGNSFFDVQQKILLTNQGIESIAPTITKMAQESGGDLKVLGLRVQDLRNQFETGLRQQGIDPTIPAVKSLLDEIFKIPPDIAVNAGLTATTNGTPQDPAQQAADLRALADALETNNGKTSSSSSSTTSTENDARKATSQKVQDLRDLADALDGSNGKSSGTSSKHKTSENDKPKPLHTLSLDIDGLRVSMENIGGKIATTSNKHASGENGKSKPLVNITLDENGLHVALSTVNGTVAATHNKHKSTENGVQKQLPVVSLEAGGLFQTLKGGNGKGASTHTRHSSSENGISKTMPLISLGAGGLFGSLRTLSGTAAGSSSTTNSFENGAQKPLNIIGQDVGGLGVHLDNLNGKNAHATVTLDLIDNMTGKLNMSLNAALSRIGGLAHGGIVDSPTLAVVGEQSRREVVVPVTRPTRALELMRATGLDQLVLSSSGDGTARSTRTSPGPARDVTALKIENAVFNEPVTADIMAAKVRAAIERIGVKA